MPPRRSSHPRTRGTTVGGFMTAFPDMLVKMDSVFDQGFAVMRHSFREMLIEKAFQVRIKREPRRLGREFFRLVVIREDFHTADENPE